ncbi:DUF4160 domain-containing protein [Myroides odoratus]|uniref:DUF4160 domain-containing protein n=1 Tax=Myroides odoratus TaxID=256 RepID=UPI0033422142
MNNIFEKIIIEELGYFLTLNDSDLEKILINSGYKSKERITTLDDLQVIIYSNDHNPPHFHVKTKDLKIDAKFTIEHCELLSGNLSSKNLKKIKAFHSSPKGKILMEAIWNKKSLI